jgi:hypothetical protein
MTLSLPLTRAGLEDALGPSVGPVACSPGDTALARVLSLPRRDAVSPELIVALSNLLRLRESPECPALHTHPKEHGPAVPGGPPPCKRCGGTGEIWLREPQVASLRELGVYRGVFGPMRVGAGKSLPTLAAATIIGAERPVLLIPASLFDKTRRDFARYALDWRVRLPHLVSYEEMGRADRETKLATLAPDLLLFDEAHHLFRDSGRVRKIARYVAAMRKAEHDQGLPFGSLLCCVALSGTLMTSSLVDYHHLAIRCLGDRAPLPVHADEAERWSLALDRELGPLRRISAGALTTIPGGYHEWFRGSRGVVPTPGSDCDASIAISLWRPEMPPDLQRVIDEVERSGMRPDDVILGPLETPACLAELALGFWSRWDPLPPEWWMLPRSDWYAYVRDVIAMRIEGLDTPLQLVNALDRNDPIAPYLGEGQRFWSAWREVKDRFVPNPVPVWIDDSPLRQAAARVYRTDTLLWVRPIAAGQRLAEFDVRYYGAGNNPERHAGGGPIVCSIDAHAEGKNLQHYSRSLVLSIPARARKHEQLIGRTHRQGQRATSVAVEYLASLQYHRDTLDRVLTEARADERASGFPQKLTLADWL